MPRLKHPMAPYPDVVFIRDIYREFYEICKSQEQQGLAGGIILGDPGIGRKACVLFMAKKSVPFEGRCRQCHRSVVGLLLCKPVIGKVL